MSGKPPIKKRQRTPSNSPLQKKKKPNGFLRQELSIGALTSKGPEWKNIDTAANLTSVANSPSQFIALQPLNLIAQGVGQQEHLGRRIAIRKLVLRYAYTSGAATSQGGFRHILIYDNNTNGALPVITDILTGPTATHMNNLSNSDRFLILKDEAPIDDKGSLTQPTQVYYGKVVLNFNPPLLQLFNTTTTASITAIQSGGIYLAVCNTGVTAAGPATYLFYSRIRYTDA